MIPESGVSIRLKEEKEKFKKGKYLTADCLEKKDLPRKILFDGSVETEISFVPNMRFLGRSQRVDEEESL